MKTAMQQYERRVKEIEAAEIKASWRDSPFFNPPSVTMLLPPCGCQIVGDGNLPSPLRIKFCAMHAASPGEGAAKEGT